MLLANIVTIIKTKSPSVVQRIAIISNTVQYYNYQTIYISIEIHTFAIVFDT